MDKQRKMMLMSMTEEEIWLSQFDERDFEASQILLDLQRQPELLPSPSPEPKEERTPFLVVWGRKKRLVSRTRRVSSGLNRSTLATLFPNKAEQSMPSTNGQSEDSCKNKRRKLLRRESAVESQPSSESGQAKKERRKLLMSELAVQNSNANGFYYAQPQQQRQSTSLLDGPINMGFLTVQRKQDMAQYEQARAREARKLRKMKIQQRQNTQKILICSAANI